MKCYKEGSAFPVPSASVYAATAALTPFYLLGDAQEDTPSVAFSAPCSCREVAGPAAKGWLCTTYSKEYTDVWEVFAAQTDISYSL